MNIIELFDKLNVDNILLKDHNFILLSKICSDCFYGCSGHIEMDCNHNIYFYDYKCSKCELILSVYDDGQIFHVIKFANDPGKDEVKLYFTNDKTNVNITKDILKCNEYLIESIIK